MLREVGSARLTGLQAYLEIDDEMTKYRMAKALSMVFAQAPRGHAEEEVIDTTAPEFATQFKGFTGGSNEIKYG